MRQFQCEPTTYVTEIKETYFEIYTERNFQLVDFKLIISDQALITLKQIFAYKCAV